MKRSYRRYGLLAGTALALMCLVGPEAMAKDQGDFLVRARAIGVVPDESATITPIGGNANVGNEYTGELDFSYFFTPHIATELILATTKHTVSATGTGIGDVDLGSVWLLPPTLTVQYHFMPDSSISPYVGAGVNYTFFYKEHPGAVVSASYENAFGVALQAGVDFEVGENMYFNLDVKKLWLNTKATYDAGELGIVSADVDINPWIFGVGIGRAF